MAKADVAGSAQDAMIILTGAVAHMTDSRAPEATARYKDAVLMAMKGKSVTEVAIMIAALGDTAAEMLRHIASLRGTEPEELLQELALIMRKGLADPSDD